MTPTPLPGTIRGMTAKKLKKPNKKPKTTSQLDTAADRRKRFIEALLSNGENITNAALAAGFSPKTAASQGSRLLKHVEVQQALNTRRAEVLQKFQLTTDRTLQEIARLAFSDPRKFYRSDGTLKPIHELDDDCAATVASIEVDEIKAGEIVVGVTHKLKQWDKNSALEKAMKHLGQYQRDNEQPGAALAAAVRDGGIALLKAKFTQVLSR